MKRTLSQSLSLSLTSLVLIKKDYIPSSRVGSVSFPPKVTYREELMKELIKLGNSTYIDKHSWQAYIPIMKDEGKGLPYNFSYLSLSPKLLMDRLDIV